MIACGPAALSLSCRDVLLQAFKSLHRSQVCGFASTGGNATSFDVVVVGGGIIGCATAREILIRKPELRVAVVEKENRLACHQTGHNSGVIHAGIYYAPGSLKAKLCVRGMDLMYKYCDENNIHYKKVGKLIVAVEPHEIERIDSLFDRAKQNNCRGIEMIDGSKIAEYEPNCKGLKALLSPHTGIINFAEVTESFGHDFEKRGGKVFLEHELSKFQVLGESPTPGHVLEYPLRLSFKNKPDIDCRHVITCAGLQCDRIAQLSGSTATQLRIVPFRGEYLMLKPEKCNLVRGNIYPVPDPRFPFLGVHFTPRINGDVWLGPNAVLAFKREGYKFTDFNIGDLYDALTFKGMRKLVMKHFAYGVGEMYRGLYIAAQIKQLQRFVPSLQLSDVIRGPAGVRAQALNDAGQLVDDFVFESGKGEHGLRILHLQNAPSPAATSSLAIADFVVNEAQKRFELLQ